MNNKTVVEFDTEMVEGLDPEEATRRALRALRHGDLGARVAGFYLLDLAERKGWRAFGCTSMNEFIELHLLVKASTARSYMSIARKLRDLPVINARFMACRLNLAQVKPIVSVAVPETDEAWADFAEGKSSREIRAEARKRNKGDLPGKGGQRRIHEPTFHAGARMTATENEQWRRFRLKVEAELGRSISDKDLMLLSARTFLSMEPDGTLPGWKRVDTSHYKIHVWPRENEDGELEFLAVGERNEVVPIVLRELVGTIPSLKFSSEVESEPNWLVLARIDPDNHRPLVPPAERDAPTSDELREIVLERDSHQCRRCGETRNVTVHHRHWRCFGGKTVRENLLTLCEGCHAMVHAYLLTVVGDPEGELRFYDHRGRPYGPARLEHLTDLAVAPGPLPPRAAEPMAALGSAASTEASEQQSSVPRGASTTMAEPTVAAAPATEAAPTTPAVAMSGATSAPRRELVTLDRLPDEVDAGWWLRNEHLLAWNERQGELILTPGYSSDQPRATTTIAPPPTALGALVGQRGVRGRLEISIAAALKRGEQLGHLLFTGPAGLGKTTLARAVAGELGAPISALPAPHVRTPDALVRALAGLTRGGVLFVDEIHALPPRVAEILYEAMDAGTLTVPVRQGVRVRPLRVRVEPFTLIGATTDPFLLSRPLQSRFRELKLEYYTEEELKEIVSRAAREQGFELTPEGAQRLARSSCETPRRALKLLAAVRDEVCVAGSSALADLSVVERALAREEVDLAGLDRSEREYLRVLEEARGPVGLKTLAAMLGTTEAQVESVHEPELLRRGYVQITPAGRVLASGGRARRIAEPDQVAVDQHGAG